MARRACSCQERKRPVVPVLASSEKSRIRCHWPRQSAPSVNGTCSERGPSRNATSRSRERDARRHDALEQRLEILEEAGLALLDADERERVRRRGCTRCPSRAARARRPSRETSFVMSITDSVGSAAAIEYGNLDARHARATSFGSRKWTSSRATVISSERRVAAAGESRGGRPHELLRRRRAGGEADRLVPVEQRRRRARSRRRSASPPRRPPARPRRAAARSSSSPSRSRGRASRPSATIAFTASWRFCVA